MKNNVIMIMMDSVAWETIGTGRCKISPTPFLDSLREEGLWTTNLYSHGPYTDAATRSLYTGRNTLDDFGYFFKLNTSPITHYKAFSEAGYQTIGYYYPYYMMGNNVTKYINKLYYKAGFEFGSEWGGIFNYYHEIYKNRELSDLERTMLYKRMELMFEVWLKLYEDIDNDAPSILDIKDILSFSDIPKAYDCLRTEYKLFKENKERYSNDFLSLGKDHILNRINDISIDNRISRDYLNRIYKRYKRFFGAIKKNNFYANVLKTLPSPKRIVHALSRYIKTRDKNEFTFFVNYTLGLTPLQVVKARWGKNRWQNMPSTRFQLNFVENEILPNIKSDKPFFLCFNIEEAHNNLSFFTYDIKDDEVINEEIEILNKYVKDLGKDFTGNLVYYLSLRYMDFCIEKFCSKLKELGLWNNTTLLFSADHGSSYTFYPVHNARVNNFYEECYHIPMLIRHPGLAPTEITSYQYSKDILPTLMDIVGLQPSPYFKGRSMLKEMVPRTFVLHEYMGPGCPDIMQRPIWFSIRDKKYVIGYKVSIQGEFEEGNLCEVYDVEKDPKCYYNLVDKIYIGKLQYLINHIKVRFEEIKVETNRYYNRLKLSENIPYNQ